MLLLSCVCLWSFVVVIVILYVPEVSVVVNDVR